MWDKKNNERAVFCQLKNFKPGLFDKRLKKLA
jgi:hypothetical protein